jgi:hypothetical protein
LIARQNVAWAKAARHRAGGTSLKSGGSTVEKDIYLTRWSNLLAGMAILAAIITSLALAYPLVFNGPLILMREHGADIWKTQIFDIPVFERVVVLFILYLPSFAWLFAIAQVFAIARNYITGAVFAEYNARCFVRIGIALAAMGVAETVYYPMINYFLFWRGISPWLADMPLLVVLRPDMFMAGLFFYVLGKIMRRASALEENDRLMI